MPQHRTKDFPIKEEIMHKVIFLNDDRRGYFLDDHILFEWMVTFTSRATRRYLLSDKLFGISALSSAQFLKINKIKQALPKIYILLQNIELFPFIHRCLATNNQKLKAVLGQASPIFNLTHQICILIAIKLLSA